MNFRLNKENGVLIYPYYNQDRKDTALLRLKEILLKIAKEDFDDVREGLSKYKKDIIVKVSGNSYYK